MNYFEIPVGDEQWPELGEMEASPSSGLQAIAHARRGYATSMGTLNAIQGASYGCAVSHKFEVRDGKPRLEFASGYNGKAGIILPANACTGWHEIGVSFFFVFDCHKGWRKRNLYPLLRKAIKSIHFGEGRWVDDLRYEVDDYLQYQFGGSIYAVPQDEIPRLHVLLGAIEI
jgi:hypothetical protein